MAPHGAAQRPFKVSKGASLWSLLPSMVCAQHVVQERSQEDTKGGAKGHCHWALCELVCTEENDRLTSSKGHSREKPS